MVRRSIFTPPAYTVIIPPPAGNTTTCYLDAGVLRMLPRRHKGIGRALREHPQPTACHHQTEGSGNLTRNDQCSCFEVRFSLSDVVNVVRGGATVRRRDLSCVGRRMKIPEPTITKAASARVFSSDDRSGAYEVSRRGYDQRKTGAGAHYR